MIEVPIFEFGQNAPVVAELGEGGPATAPGYTLHGVWYDKGSDVACCWQVRDDTISLYGVNMKRVHEQSQVRHPRRLRFEGAILPKPSLFSIRDHKKDAGVTHHLVLCTSKGELKVVPLKITESYIETNQSPFPTIPLQNAQRVTSCNLIQRPDGSVRGFIGTSNWGQRDGDVTLAEVKIIDVQIKDLSYKDTPALKFTKWVGRSKNVTAVAACANPGNPEQHIIITLQGNDAVIYKASQDAHPQEVLRFAVDSTGGAQFSTDINTVVSGSTLIVAFIRVRPANSVHIFRINIHDFSYTAMPSRPCPIHEAVLTRASIRTTSSALYVVWQAEPHHTAQDTLPVPLLFAALPSTSSPQLAITCLPLEEAKVIKEWQTIDLESKKRANLGGTSHGQGEIGVCVIDGNDIEQGARDICCVMRPSGICVLRDADPLETEGVVECIAEQADDMTDAEPLNHPYVSYSIMTSKSIHQSDFLKMWKQCDTVINLVTPVIDSLLPKLLAAKADDLPSILADIEFLLFMESGSGKQNEVAQVSIDNVLRVAAEIAKRVEQGYTTDVAGTPLAAFGTAQQMAFAMLVLSLHRAALLSIARHLAVGDEVGEVNTQLRSAIDSLMLYSHVYSVFGTEHIQLAHMSAVTGNDMTSVRLFTSVRDVIQMLMSIDDIPTSSLLSSLFSSPITVPSHITAMLSLQQANVSAGYRRLVINHIYANVMLLEVDHTEVSARFHAVAGAISVLSKEEQDMFMSFAISLIPTNLRCDWGHASLGVRCDVLYLYLSVAALVFLDDSRKLDSVDAALGRNSTLTGALRAAAVAIMPPVEHLLSSVTVWSPPAWEVVLRVNTWMFERALESCGKAVHVQDSATGHFERSNNWDTVFRSVMSCPDPRILEQLMSTLVETIVNSGSLAIQRFIATNWSSRMITPIASTIAKQDTAHAMLTVTLPKQAAHKACREAERDIVISVVSGGHDLGQGLALKKAVDCVAEEASNTVIRIHTSMAVDNYQISVGPVLQDALRAEGRPMLIVISYAGLPPAVLRCNATGSSLSLAPEHAYHAQPSSVICKVLWNKGNDKFITDLAGKHGGANYFHLLAQFLAHRSEFMSAARVTYRIAEKIRAAPRAGIADMEAASRALATAINLLKVGRKESFSLQGDEPLYHGKQDEQEVVSIADLQNRRVTVEVELALLRSSGDATITPLQLQQSTWEQIQEMLLSRKLFIQAATFANAWKLDQTQLFVSGVKTCITAETQAVSAAVKATLWDEILTLLEKYSTAEVQWKYHVVVVATFLKEITTSQLPPSRAMQPLRFYRPDLAVRELLKCGSLVCLVEAVAITEEYLRWQLVNKATTAFAPKAVIPVTLLDALVASVADRLARLGTDLSQMDVLFKCRAEQLFALWKQPATTTICTSVSLPTPSTLPPQQGFGRFFGGATSSLALAAK